MESLSAQIRLFKEESDLGLHCLLRLVVPEFRIFMVK